MEKNEEDACKLRLGVGEQFHAASTRTKDDHDHHRKKTKEPLISLGLDLCCPKVDHDHDHTDHTIPSGGNSSSKTNNDIQDDHDQEDYAGKCRRKKNDNNNIVTNDSNSRKKLKLTKEQTTFLEGCFKFNNTLYPAQKRELAEQLNLKPRQVEVWFQNRRARTKMKQMEEDCETLKKCCESLGQENKRLGQELQELRSMKVEHPCRELQDHIWFAKNAKLTLCPYCQKMSKLDDDITD